MITWKQIFGPNFSVEQIEAVLIVGAFGSILAAVLVLLYLYCFSALSLSFHFSLFLPTFSW